MASCYYSLHCYFSVYTALFPGSTQLPFLPLLPLLPLLSSSPLPLILSSPLSSSPYPISLSSLFLPPLLSSSFLHLTPLPHQSSPYWVHVSVQCLSIYLQCTALMLACLPVHNHCISIVYYLLYMHHSEYRKAAQEKTWYLFSLCGQLVGECVNRASW